MNHYLTCQDENCFRVYCVARREYEFKLARTTKELTAANAEIERQKIRVTEKSEMIKELLREQKDFVQESFDCRKLIGEQGNQLTAANALIEKLTLEIEKMERG